MLEGETWQFTDYLFVNLKLHTVVLNRFHAAQGNGNVLLAPQMPPAEDNVNDMPDLTIRCIYGCAAMDDDLAGWHLFMLHQFQGFLIRHRVFRFHQRPVAMSAKILGPSASRKS